MEEKKHNWKYIDNLKVYYIYRKDKKNYELEVETDSDLKEIPFSSILMKLDNYNFLHTGKGLAHCSKQSKDIYREFRNKSLEDIKKEIDDYESDRDSSLN